jgi:hypothetical protein
MASSRAEERERHGELKEAKRYKSRDVYRLPTFARFAECIDDFQNALSIVFIFSFSSRHIVALSVRHCGLV